MNLQERKRSIDINALSTEQAEILSETNRGLNAAKSLMKPPTSELLFSTFTA